MKAENKRCCRHYREGLPYCAECAKAESDRTEALHAQIAELKAELAEKQAIADMCHKRTMEADKLWQVAHNQPNVWPDLGMLVEWLMKRADDMRCCYNCKYGPMCSVDARVCSGCSFAHNNPADGQMKWEEKKL